MFEINAVGNSLDMGVWPHGIRSETSLVEISNAIISWCVGASEVKASFTLIAGAATTVSPAPSCSIASADCELEDN